MAGYTCIWEFEIKPGSEAEFLRHYNNGGSWVALFLQAQGFRETLLLQDRQSPLRYLTIDRWDSVEAYGAFRRQFAALYADLDALCENLTLTENCIGEFGDSL
ncbi:antibiotic biosynthesis monooxygenase family protein [Bowmanella dokdonensis]|uniref:Antibiotic biosynthesis monooxygenase n=1 Tax=Bowmanella dokdonensis TaxID=751969 RepID=A0A939IR92_9ALTE|nr:antibiotic biosynthesis monooxygenase family protein [Bowmanella dokdonensis]MBN7825407.1 antibiotic biosynthesis monooxygenase [Bowmanella dokdonensis]